MYRSRLGTDLSDITLDYVSSIKDDHQIALYDILGSQAHTLMLYENQIITKNDAKKILSALESLKNEKFDTIIFNPPYLPEQEPKDVALDGGKKGYEVLERFFNEVKNYLNSNGVILVVFSSLTNKNKIDDIIKRNKLKSKLLEEKSLFFEKLYVYLIEKNGTA